VYALYKKAQHLEAVYTIIRGTYAYPKKRMQQRRKKKKKKKRKERKKEEESSPWIKDQKALKYVLLP
jgi:hypothetical protein